jgi:hypothetical protein
VEKVEKILAFQIRLDRYLHLSISRLCSNFYRLSHERIHLYCSSCIPFHGPHLADSMLAIPPDISSRNYRSNVQADWLCSDRCPPLSLNALERQPPRAMLKSYVIRLVFAISLWSLRISHRNLTKCILAHLRTVRTLRSADCSSLF